MEAVEKRLNGLEEMGAKKLWDFDRQYLQRGTHESVRAAVFSLTEMVRRYPGRVASGKIVCLEHSTRIFS